LVEKIGDNPGRSGYRQILCVASPIDQLMRIGKRRGQPCQQAEADHCDRYWFEMVAVVPSNFVMLMVNGSL
jgi:hypothetical protein